MKSHISPPKLFLRFFRWFCHPKLLRHIEGDLMELYSERVKEFGKRKADLKFIGDVLLLFRPGIIKPTGESYTLNDTGMLENYFKVGVRNFLKYKAFSFINVFGFSIAMSVCLLVILMLADQYSYDKFHPKRDRVFRILSERPYSSMPFASTPPSLALALREEYSLVESATNLILNVGGDVSYNQRLTEIRGFFTDESFFNVFGYELKQGNKTTALTSPNALVISSDIAHTLFGDENPLGKTVEFTDRGLHYMKSGKDTEPVSWGSFTITGVMADKKYKSHLKFDVLMSTASMEILTKEDKLHISDSWDKAFTYVLLQEGKSKMDLDASLQDVIDHKYSSNENYADHLLKAQVLTAITPGVMVNQPPSIQLPIEAYYFLGFIALAIMLSACLNYTNLSTARALTRVKEIGVRKVTGAYRKDLILQFLCEAIITSVFALVLAIFFLIFLKPAFINLWLNKYLNFDLHSNPYVYLVFAVFAIVMGILAGLYPALHLSTFHPIKAIKNSGFASRGKLGVRKILSVSQFVISLFFVITSILIYTQFKFFTKFNYGFDARDIVNVSLQGNDFQKVSTAFNAIPGVSEISASEYVPATGRSSGMDINHPENQEPINFRILSADENFLSNLDLKVIAGRGLPGTTDSASRSIVINETAVKKLGLGQPADAVGLTLIQTWNKEPLEVVGVVKDFWITLPISGDLIEPAFLRNQSRFSYANVKIISTNAAKVVKQLETAWKKVDPIHPFKYEYYDDELASTHAGIFDLVSIVGFLAFIAVTIACLGMLGMATYTAERKKKEVGIRKVMGAPNTAIALMLSKDFLKVLVIAVCIGAPLSYMVNNLWLQTFPVRADFGFDIVILGTLLLLFLGLLTIGSQTVRASKQNPVESLKAD